MNRSSSEESMERGRGRRDWRNDRHGDRRRESRDRGRNDRDRRRDRYGERRRREIRDGGRDQRGDRQGGRRHGNGGRDHGDRHRGMRSSRHTPLSYDEMIRETEAGRILDPAHLIQDIVLCRASKESKECLILNQVALAEERHLVPWLSTVAWEATEMCERSWIERHIGPIPNRTRRAEDSRACRVDIRKFQPGGIQSVQEFCVGSAPAGAASATESRPTQPMEDDRSIPESVASTNLLVREIEEIVGPDVISVDFSELDMSSGADTLLKDESVRGTGADCATRGMEEAEGGADCATVCQLQVPEGGAVCATVSELASGGKDGQRNEDNTCYLDVNMVVKGGQKKSRSRKRKRRHFFKPCPIPWCMGNFDYAKLHVMEFHCPTKLDPQAGTGTDVTRDRVEALAHLARTILGDNGTIQGLIQAVNSWKTSPEHPSYHPGRQVDTLTVAITESIARHLGIPIPDVLLLDPVNSPGCLYHWSLLAQLLQRLSREQHHQFVRMFSHPSREEEIRQRTPGGEEAQVLICEPSVEPTDQEAPGGEQLDYEDISDESTAKGTPEYEDVSDESTVKGTPDFNILVESTVEGTPERIVRLVSRKEPVPEPEVDAVYGTDCHFHMDRLSRALGLPQYSLFQAMDREHPREEQIEIRAAVTSFCDPETYPSEETIADLNTQGVEVTVGLHPLKAGSATEFTFQRLWTLLQRDDVKGLGEVGLDYRVDLRAQQRALDRMLDWLTPNQVLVLHCRGSTPSDHSSLLATLFYLCRGKLPQDTRIHLHCFKGDTQDVQLWSSYFSNCYFGCSGMVESYRPDNMQALRSVETSRLLLETDAPYFPLRGARNSTPAYIGMIAAGVGRILGRSRDDILRETSVNARRFFRL